MTSQRLKVVVERHADGTVAYPLGIHGVVVGQGETYDEALEDVRSAIAFHREAFGPAGSGPGNGCSPSKIAGATGNLAPRAATISIRAWCRRR